MLKSIPNNSKNNLKLNLEIIPNDNNLDEVISNALMTQLMVTIAQIGIRVDKIDEISKAERIIIIIERIRIKVVKIL